MRKAFGFLILAALAAGAGCGGGGDASAPTAVKTVTVTDPGAPPTEAGTTTGISDSEAQTLAESMLLRLSDFPTGWRADPPEDDEASCGGIEKLEERYDELAKADSDEFAQGETTQATSTIHLFSEEETAREALDYVEASTQSERFRECLADFFRDQADIGVTVGDVRVGQVSFPTLGDRSSAWEVVVPVESEGTSVTVYLDVVYIRRGPAFSAVLFTEVFSPFDEMMREDLARTVSERMDAAVAEFPS